MNLGMKILILISFVLSIFVQPNFENSSVHKESAFTEVSSDEDLRFTGFELTYYPVEDVKGYDFFYRESCVLKQLFYKNNTVSSVRLTPLLLDLPPPVLS